MGLGTNGTHSSQMEIPNGNFPDFFVNGKRPKAQVFFLTETKIDSTYPDSQFALSGYNIFRNDRKKKEEAA